MLLNDTHSDWNERDNDTRPVVATLSTDGKGFWSSVKKSVGITGFVIGYLNEEETFGELRVQFNTDTWRPDRDGLIYTDARFMHELKVFLAVIGLAFEDVSYSEQGMQGDNYVSCDVGAKFLASYKAKYPVEYQTALQG